MVVALPSIAAGRAPEPSDDLFENSPIPELRIRISAKQEAKLREDPRNYVDCALVENETKTYGKVRVKLKGQAGSFREFDDRPALTISLKKSSERFHGLTKFHLNNSVQDELYLHELIAAQICAEAGCPAARVTHARVWLNDRDLGLYVLKEGYDDVFLARHFANPKGNLYDGGFCQDIDGELKKDEGDGPDDRSDLAGLVAACREEDPERRSRLIDERLDVDAFLNFVALELMLCHWDGYAHGPNNYRIYFRSGDRKAVFFPHGMDQILEDPNFSVFQIPGSLVAHAVLENPEWNSRYRTRVEELLPLFAPERLHAKIDAGLARIRPVAEKMSDDFAHDLDERAREFKELVNDRQERILHPLPPEPIEFNEEGWVQIEDWEPHEPEDALLEEQEHEGCACLLIAVGESNQSAASYRTKVILNKGRYRLVAEVKTIDVNPVEDERGPGGAGVRVSGQPSQSHISGSSDWQTVSHTFEIDEETREVELIVELRASSGSAFFDIPSLRLVKAD
jgi:hypothetical protein